MRALLVVALLATPATADHQVGGGYMMSRPISGESGGADHAGVVRWLGRVGVDVDVGLALELGHAPGNTNESLTRFAVLPTFAYRADVGDSVAGVDIAFGWQLAHGTTNVAGVPVTGSESRGIRGEVGLYFAAPVASKTWLRARLGVSLDGIYPQTVDAQTKLGPFGELGVAFTL
jgi:hypothetical protein